MNVLYIVDEKKRATISDTGVSQIQKAKKIQQLNAMLSVCIIYGRIHVQYRTGQQ